MTLKIDFFDPENQELAVKDISFGAFLETIKNPEVGFFGLPDSLEHLEDCRQAYERFQHKEYFVQVGIGGSSLGPELLVSALGNEKVHFEFINNIDSDEIFRQLSHIDPKKCLFYIVSKSGGTAETMAGFAIIANLLADLGIGESEWPNYFVFGTDPVKSDLLELGKEKNVTCLQVPSNIGGRFSVLSSVGLFPAFFAGLNVSELLFGAKEFKEELLQPDYHKNILVQSCGLILDLYKRGFNQTVLMPYSSRLRNLSFWFVQIWAESLGKKLDTQGKVVNTGLTPIPAYGATDQHSQVQLFMEGPYDKLLIMLNVKERQNDFSLKNSLTLPSLEKLSGRSLNQLMQAEYHGTLQALEGERRPYISITLERLDERSLAQLILYFECLTTLVGHSLGIDPFNQPGVEAGKRYAFEFLAKIN
ncbi:MAG: hypothetical protein HN509_01215 [Halobacteriovoraceae bacterium]|jgi:glucose-6-phosphate isomerase|nr:hypothetical protein [Halobacteriovoraceae bacterium]MBT5094190.1 hypothetical protein [Halobacteriovoraceae bacterium]